VALIQGSIDSEFKYDPRRQMRIMEQYLHLSHQARRRYQPDLIVWPETMYRNPLWVVAPDATTPPDFQGTLDELRREARGTQAALESLAAAMGGPVVVGVDAYHFGREHVDHYNAAAFVDASGKLQPRYDKEHLVMFGEYVPFAEAFPWLYRLTPLRGGLKAGRNLPAWRLNNVVLCPNICFESCLAHVVRRQVQELARRGSEPHVLLNLTNDGWFWGSSELDMHLACNVFRAVECRKPHLVAANTGISAWIDGSGRILARGPRRDTAVLLANVRLDGRHSPYLLWGDWPAGTCLLLCAVIAAGGLRSRGIRQPPRQA
jgi:apolipoprotein N-acyltransferase